MDKRIKVTLKKSLNRRLASHQASARGLGLRRLNSTAVVADTPQIRGMISRISYMVAVEDA